MFFVQLISGPPWSKIETLPNLRLLTTSSEEFVEKLLGSRVQKLAGRAEGAASSKETLADGGVTGGGGESRVDVRVVAIEVILRSRSHDFVHFFSHFDRLCPAANA